MSLYNNWFGFWSRSLVSLYAFLPHLEYLLLTLIYFFLCNQKTEYDRKEARAKETMLRIGAELLQQRKRGEFGLGTEKDEGSQRDLLTVLVKANQDPDIPESQRMDDDEVIAQVPTFLVAGHETTR